CICFLFSSRRRHTRFSRDWSSDVCSSDLTTNVTQYHFEITAPDNSVQTISTSASHFQLTDLDQYDYGTTYSVRVGMDVNGVWQEIGRASCRARHYTRPTGRLTRTTHG